jgi:hypothetical protein
MKSPQLDELLKTPFHTRNAPTNVRNSRRISRTIFPRRLYVRFDRLCIRAGKIPQRLSARQSLRANSGQSPLATVCAADWHSGPDNFGWEAGVEAPWLDFEMQCNDHIEMQSMALGF